jgi:hypothetical protein
VINGLTKQNNKTQNYVILLAEGIASKCESFVKIVDLGNNDKFGRINTPIPSIFAQSQLKQYQTISNNLKQPSNNIKPSQTTFHVHHPFSRSGRHL